MKILFLDQSGKLGGAELSLMDVAKPYRQSCLIGLFEEGPYRQRLEQQQIPVQVLAGRSLQVRKDSSFLQSLNSVGQLVPLIARVARLSCAYDVIYTNTQKALVVGALASAFSRRPLVYHLRDILSEDHFSRANLRMAVTLANRFAALVIVNSRATRAAFVKAGGRAELTEVVYNGFQPEQYHSDIESTVQLRQQLDLDGRFVVGHFSRLSPWKGQHVLIEALMHCPEEVTAVFVGDALFGEHAYVEKLHQLVAKLELEHRVRFLGFRSDVAQLMSVCDLVAHTSTAPEPFGRVIVEAMLCGRPVVAAEDGGAVELVEQGKTGWLVPPNDSFKLAEVIQQCYEHREQTGAIAQQSQLDAIQRFHLDNTNQQIAQFLHEVVRAS